MGSEASCYGGGLSANCLLIIHFTNTKIQHFPFFSKFQTSPPPAPTAKFYTFEDSSKKTFEKSSKNSQIIIELRTVT